MINGIIYFLIDFTFFTDLGLQQRPAFVLNGAYFTVYISTTTVRNLISPNPEHLGFTDLDTTCVNYFIPEN